jgi:hypothetical protein
MKYIRLFSLLALGLISTHAFGYGSSSSTKACTKPHFSEFVPADKSDAAPQSTFSFLASSATDPKSIEVSIKKQPIEIKISPKGQGYEVTGTLPADVKGTTARISITAESPSNCKGNGGWLIKVSP